MENGSNYTRSAESILAQVNSSIESLDSVQDPEQKHQILYQAEQMLQAMQGSDLTDHDIAIEDAWRRLRAAQNQAEARIAG